MPMNANAVHLHCRSWLLSVNVALLLPLAAENGLTIKELAIQTNEHHKGNVDVTSQLHQID